jgi:uncharacterized repeat protein (TIGR03943 family)
VSDTDRAGLLVVIGGLAVCVASTDLILRYLRPTMRPWLMLAGLPLFAIGLAGLVIARRAHSPAAEEHEHRRPSRLGYLLLAPAIVLLLFNPGALGSYAVSKQSSIRFSEADFDLREYLRTHTVAGQAPQLQLMEFAIAAWDDESATLLARDRVRLTGFVVHLDGTLYLARLQMGCCAGDAIATTVRLAGVRQDLEDDTWIDVTGRFDPEATKRTADGYSPVMRVESWELRKEPAEPYEYYR